MTLSLVTRPAAATDLRPRYLDRALPLNSGEQIVARWLREIGLRPVHERWFYPFWIDELGRPHGFRLDFTFTFEGRLMGLEVCEAGRYPEPPSGSNRAKWRPPAVKFQDKCDKIDRLAAMHSVPCALVTDAEIDSWRSLSRAHRRHTMGLHLAAALELVPSALAR